MDFKILWANVSRPPVSGCIFGSFKVDKQDVISFRDLFIISLGKFVVPWLLLLVRSSFGLLFLIKLKCSVTYSLKLFLLQFGNLT